MWISSSRSTTVALLLLFFTSLASCAAIIGIDYGTEFIKAALVKPGIPLEIVLTKDSKRKEAAAVAFKPKSTVLPDATSPERLYGVDAVNYAARFPDSVYPNLKPLLGTHILADDAVKTYKARYPALELLTSKEGKVSFKSVASSSDEKFSVEELIAMQLSSVKKSAEAMAGQKINDCVMAIPAYFTSEERYALTAAAELAGLKVLTLISDGLAVALNYATTRTYTPDSAPEHHVIYDMGSGSTTATVVKISGKTVKDYGKFMKNVVEITVQGVGYDRTLGGNQLNQIMADYLLSEFAESKGGKKLSQEHGKPISEILNGRSFAKLWREATRVRQILSANSEAIAGIESIYPDVDFRSGKIQRSTFEDLTAGYLDRIVAPIKDAVANAKLADGLNTLDSVIISGGASRTPFVQKALEDLVGESKISKNVNADEAAVMGATFRAAGLSKNFRVKDIRIADVLPYSVDLKYKPEGSDNVVTQTLFNPPAKIGVSKFVPFKRATDTTFSLSTSGGVRVDEITTTNLTASFNKLKSDFGCQDTEISTRFSIRLSDKDGLPEVVDGTVSCEVEKKKGKLEGKVDDVKGFFGFGKKDDKEKVLKDEKAAKDEKKDKKDSKAKEDKKASSSSSAPGASESGTSTDTATAEATPAKPVMVTEKIHIAFTTKRTDTPEFTAEQLETSKKMLQQFDADEKTRHMREEARNDLEAYTYRCLEHLSQDAFVEASTSKERDTLEAKLAEVSDWIYSKEAEGSPQKVFQEKLKELKDIEVPISRRVKQAAARPEKVKQLREALTQVDSMVKMMETSLELHEKNEAIRKAAEAAESAKEAAESAASSVSSSETTAAPSPSSADPLDDLEDKDTSSSTSTTTATSSRTTKKSKPKPTPAPFTKDEISSLHSHRKTVGQWLDEKMKAQEALKSHEEPALLVEDVNAKAEEINKMITKLMNKKPGSQQKAGKIKVDLPNYLKDFENVDFDNMDKEALEAWLEKLQKASGTGGEDGSGPKLKVSRVSEDMEQETATRKHDEL